MRCLHGWGFGALLSTEFAFEGYILMTLQVETGSDTDYTSQITIWKKPVVLRLGMIALLDFHVTWSRLERRYWVIGSLGSRKVFRRALFTSDIVSFGYRVPLTGLGV